MRSDIKNLCVSTLGSGLVDTITYLTDFVAVETALRSTAEMLAIVQANDDVPLQNVIDVTPQLKTLSVPGTFLTTQELQRLRRALTAMDEIYGYFLSKKSDNGEPFYPYICGEIAGLATFGGCISAINGVVDKNGDVKDTASETLASVRAQLRSTGGSVNMAMRRVLSKAVSAGVIDADAAPTMRDGRLVLPVAPMNKRKIPGIVHDESASGKTVFIEPIEVVEANNRIRELQIEERREIVRVLTVLADSLRPSAADILASCDILAKVDFIHAKASYANQIDAHLPVLSSSPELEWYHACHPGLMQHLKKHGKDIVPLDIALDKEHRILIISGPNAGGKSVCLKTVGVIQYMMQCGILPPVYENSRMGIFDDIFVDIGDDQSLEDDLSTYSSHLKNMKLFLQRGRGGSLLLIDEFGGGTEPQIGGALAQAILRQFNNLNMWGVITTHYQNLKHFAEDTAGLINGSMLYDRQLMQPLFKLSIGNPGSSFAVEIARKIGLPAAIITDAEEIVGSDYINMDKYLLDIARDKRYWENKRQSIRLKEKKIEAALERYETDADELKEKRRDIINEAKSEAKKILEGTNALIERTIHEIRRSQADKEKTLEARRKLDESKRSIVENISESKLLKKSPARKKKTDSKSQTVAEGKPISVGDVVKLDGQGTPGKVLELNGKDAVVVFGMLRTTVKTSRLHHTSATIKSGASKSASFISETTSNEMRNRQLEFKQDIDLRGMRVDEAVQAVTYFIDDAIQFNASRVRILHGTGTGALRQSIRQYLDSVPGVKSYRDEHVQYGGAGITVVELEQ